MRKKVTAVGSPITRQVVWLREVGVLVMYSLTCHIFSLLNLSNV